MFVLEICDVQFLMNTFRLDDEFYYDITNIKVQRQKQKSEFTIVAVTMALP